MDNVSFYSLPWHFSLPVRPNAFFPTLSYAHLDSFQKIILLGIELGRGFLHSTLHFIKKIKANVYSWVNPLVLHRQREESATITSRLASHAEKGNLIMVKFLLSLAANPNERGGGHFP